MSRPESRLPLPLLITGIAGVAGHSALGYFQAKYPGRVIGVCPRNNGRLTGPGIVGCDLEDARQVARLFDRHRFAAVLDCAGNCALKPCELNPAMAHAANVGGVENLLEQTVPRRCRLVHLSIDLVFAGRPRGGYRESEPTDPVTVYGKTMVLGEQAVLAADPAACILRISLPMGASPSGHAGAIDWIASRFARNLPATLYFDEIRTPTYNDCLHLLYEVALARDLEGIFHAGGPRRLSLYQIAQIINRVGGYDPDLLFGIPRGHAGPIPPRAGNVAMNSSKLAGKLGFDPFDPWPLDENLVPTDRHWHRRRGPGQPGSPQYLHQVLCINPARRKDPRVA